jgi:hypothetical protein
MKRNASIAGLVLLAAFKSNAQITLDLNSVDASAGSVDATSFLASYGITETPLVAGSGFLIFNQNNWYGTPGIVYASPPPNFLTESLGGANSVLLTFATPLTGLSFTRMEETGSGAGNSFGTWSAEVFSGATQIGSAGAPGYSIFNNSVNPAQTYTFTGAGITSVEFDGNSEGFYGSSSILMDDLTITPAPEPTTSALVAGLGGLSLMQLRRRRKQVISRNGA